MVSTVAGSDVSGYVGLKDIVMVPSIVDVAGINRVSREVFARGQRPVQVLGPFLEAEAAAVHAGFWRKRSA